MNNDKIQLVDKVEMLAGYMTAFQKIMQTHEIHFWLLKI